MHSTECRLVSAFWHFPTPVFFCLNACRTSYCVYFDAESSQYFYVVMVARCCTGSVSL